MGNIIMHPLFSLTLTIGAYIGYTKLKDKTKLRWINPFLFSIITIIAFLLVFDIPYSTYKRGGDFITMFLTPITALLALSIYSSRRIIKENLLIILAGTIAGSVASITSVILLSNILNVDDSIKFSLITKSVTTPIAMALSEMMGGIGGIAAVAVLIAGLMGNVLAPSLVKLLKLNDHSEQGIAIGTTSHALGTAKALEMGEDIGAISSVSLSFSAIITTIIVMVFL